MQSTTAQTSQTRDLVIGLDELANVLGKTPDYLKRNWLKLHQKLGMPRKHPAAFIWPRGAINVWLTSQAYVEAVPGNDNTGDLPPSLHETRVAEQRAALHASMGVGE
ncbi:hypothetical protein FMN50_20390 [Rhodobacterales bacterium]|nr:hypothetical protein FMN50_20390 [Rhodobacterales bacterium]